MLYFSCIILIDKLNLAKSLLLDYNINYLQKQKIQTTKSIRKEYSKSI